VEEGVRGAENGEKPIVPILLSKSTKKEFVLKK
jgi:hypothetical protein